jgi:hypothetical protein
MPSKELGKTTEKAFVNNDFYVYSVAHQIPNNSFRFPNRLSRPSHTAPSIGSEARSAEEPSGGAKLSRRSSARPHAAGRRLKPMVGRVL